MSHAPPPPTPPPPPPPPPPPHAAAAAAAVLAQGALPVGGASLLTTAMAPNGAHAVYVPELASFALQHVQLHMMHMQQQQQQQQLLHQQQQQQQQQHSASPDSLSHTTQSTMCTAGASDAGASVPPIQMESAYRIGRYTPAERRVRLQRYREKRAQRNYSRRIKYDCRKLIADKRRRVQGRFVKREHELELARDQQLREQQQQQQQQQQPLTEAVEVLHAAPYCQPPPAEHVLPHFR